MPGPLVRASDLRIHYPLFKGFLQRLLGGGRRYVRAVDGVSFSIEEGEVFGLVGESGCGKSTTGRALLGLAPVTGGEIAIEFPGPTTDRRWVRPRGVAVVALAWWASAALYAAGAAIALATGRAVLTSATWPLAPSLVLAAWLVLAPLQGILATALWRMRPWSRRAARTTALLAVLVALDALPAGLLPLFFNVGVAAYLGNSEVSALIRRSGWRVPVTRFSLGPRGILEGSAAEDAPSRIRSWFVGPRAVSTSGLSWIVRQLRAKVQIVYQDPHAALSPALTIGESIEHALRAHWESVVAAAGPDGPGPREPTRPVLREAAEGLLNDVGLRPPGQFYPKRPTEISGGQKQRVVIARALAPRPRLLVADEPVALLDMSIRAKVLELLLDLKRKYGLTYVFITHDLATAKLVCDRIAIMYLGRIVEVGPSARIFEDPKHPYTRALLQAIPIPDPKRRREKVLPKGEVPDAVDPPAGCRFHPRCPVALPTCGWEGRDFIDYLEERRMDPQKEAEERSAFGELSEWTADGLVAWRQAKEADTAVAIPRLRKAIDEASQPMREAVVGVGFEEGRVVVRFRAPDDLRPKEVDGRQVECLLF